MSAEQTARYLAALERYRARKSLNIKTRWLPKEIDFSSPSLRTSQKRDRSAHIRKRPIKN
ncbi:MAG: hypothetical protein Hyperionvirus2_5 [Hyperionvirus sp.]|uniref:Uncharacterized protein n=1 Tax=Hyperionvirus sp. TaxID=2487770 RepID=A0A3G5A5Y0_9VIRU|nr:MAG: hypothetical protein Hyperionvirus2_5 [Hyperionvirus sp.]